MPTNSRQPVGLTEADYGMFQELLERMFGHDCHRTFFLDWLSWSLQNEGRKPSFSILLYSQTKGTGKSTIGQVLSALFGPSNSIGINGISKLTSRFNQTLMSKKFITCEEVKLKPGTDAGNAVKSFITEARVAVEALGRVEDLLANTEVDGNGCMVTETEQPRKLRFHGHQDRAYRFVYCITHRLAATRDQVIRHRCHNRLCINPRHLTIGDRRDNLQDERDRQANGVDWGLL